MLDESAHASLLAALDVAVSRSIDAYNIAAEGGETDLADDARACVDHLKALRATVQNRPTRPARWKFARSPRGDARSR